LVFAIRRRGGDDLIGGVRESRMRHIQNSPEMLSPRSAGPFLN
jgi:hypothetical protein